MLSMDVAQVPSTNTLACAFARKSSDATENIDTRNEDRDISRFENRKLLGSKAFRQWRPRFHLMASQGWMNDPCAPGYDPISQSYHVGFQWNNRGNDWGNICWGSASSKDLVSWKVSETASLSPAAPYDKLGIFTGCMVPLNLSGVADGTMTCFYTSVDRLPISYRLKYEYGSESLSVATSKDTGKTWHRSPLNPILPGPPANLEVTGWRDPFVATWPSLSTFLGRDQHDKYGVISGGIAGKTPTTFLYAINSENLAEWTYVGPLVDLGLNHFVSQWSGDLGVNWEVVNFVTLVDDNSDHSMEVLIVSAEGTLSEHGSRFHYTSPWNEARKMGPQLWLSGSFQRTDTQNETKSYVSLRRDYGGIMDHGCFYAANSFWDPVTEQTALIGWIPEDDLPDELRHKQGWSGCLSLLRVIGVQTLHRVLRARVTHLKELTSFSEEVDEMGSVTLRTLRIRPHPALKKLRKKAREHDLMAKDWSDIMNEKNSLALDSMQWEVHCQMALHGNCTRAGIRIGYPSNDFNYVHIYYDVATSSIIVDRSAMHVSNTRISTAPEIAPFTLFTTWDTTHECEVEEKLDIKIMSDSSVMEIFVNERVAITTRIYYDAEIIGGPKLSFFSAGDDEGEVKSMMVKTALFSIWDGLGSD